MRLRGGRRHDAVRRIAVRVLARPAHHQTIQVQVDHRCREQCQHLAQNQAPDHRVAERLAQLRAGAVAEHQRQRTEDRRRGGHHDGPEAQQAGLADGRQGLEVLVTLGMNREVHHHDAVLLDDADQQDDADQPHDRQVEVKQHQHQECSHASRGEGGENGQRMDVALIENTQDDVHHQQRRQDQQRRRLQR
jgi:hypothetical protein